MKKIFALILLAAISAFAQAKTPCANRVCEEFYQLALVTNFSTSMQASLLNEKAFQAEASTGGESAAAVYADGMRNVVKEAKEKVSPKYQAALKSAASNKEVTVALKELYTKWLSGMTYYQNGYTESIRAKEKQYKQIKNSIDDAWARVLTEAGI